VNPTTTRQPHSFQKLCWNVVLPVLGVMKLLRSRVILWMPSDVGIVVAAA
jgi:hypothetical protein